MFLNVNISYPQVKTRSILESIEPTWNDEFIVELEGSENVRILAYEETKTQGTVLRGKATLELSRSWLGGSYNEQRISMGDLMLTCQTKYLAFEETIRRVPAAKPTGLFRTSISQTTKKEKRAIPFVITSAVREVERRGITEVGIYRVSGSATDMARLKVRLRYMVTTFSKRMLLINSELMRATLTRLSSF